MTTPSLNDLRYQFFGGEPGMSLTDAEYASLQDAFDAGFDLPGIIGSVGAPTFVDVPDRGAATSVEVVDGRITNKVYRFVTDSGDSGVLLVPPAEDHDGERVVIIGGDTNPSGVAEASAPTIGALLLGELFGPFSGLDAVVDLTTATLGHDFIVKAVIGTTEHDSDPVDDTFDLQSSNPDLESEVFRLIGVLANAFTPYGCVLNLNDGTLSATEAGKDNAPSFADDQEAIGGIDITQIDKQLGGQTVTGIAGRYGRGIENFFSAPADTISGNSEYWFDNYYTAIAHRTLVLLASDGEWIIEHGPVFPREIKFKSNVSNVSTVDDLGTQIFFVGSTGLNLANGSYYPVITVTDGVGVLSVEPVAP